MSFDDVAKVTDPLEAIRSLFKEMTDVKAELSSCKSDAAAVRRNNARLYAENKKLRKENAHLREEIERLGGRHVEKDSSNSSIPPTKQPLDKQIVQHTKSLRTKSGKKPGGQAGHEGHSLDKTGTPDNVEEHRVTLCPHCGMPIPADAVQTCVKSVQVIEIASPMTQPEVTEHREYIAVCPHCHKTARGENPTGKCKNVMYGPMLQAMVVYLSIVHSIPYNRIAEFMHDVFMVETFSEGTIKNILARNTEKSTPIYDSILTYIEKEKAAGMDETGAYINNALCWFWCLQCPRFCYVFADRSRGIKALEEHDILRHLEGLILYTDRHGTYFKLKVEGHQVCLVHLLRNLQYLNDLNREQTWSSRVQDLLREAIHQSKTIPLPQIDVGEFRKRLDELLEEDVSGYERKGKTDFQVMQNGLFNCKDYVFTFLEHDGVPHHNNSSEASIRVLKVKTKVSGCFRTREGADEYACFHSLAETAKRNGVAKFKALYQLISQTAPKAEIIESWIAAEN